jgi:hypothetical protein
MPVVVCIRRSMDSRSCYRSAFWSFNVQRIQQKVELGVKFIPDCHGACHAKKAQRYGSIYFVKSRSEAKERSCFALTVVESEKHDFEVMPP